MKKLMKKTISAIIAFVITATAIAPVSALAAYSGYGEDKFEHSGVAYSDMVYTGYDPAAMYAVVDDMKAKMSDAKNSQDIIDDYEKMMREVNIFETQYVLNQIQYYRDVTVPEYAEIDIELSELWTELVDLCQQVIREALNSPCGDALKKHINNPGFVEDMLAYEDMTDREKEINILNQELIQEYDTADQGAYTTIYNGVEWTRDEAYEAYATGQISVDDYNVITREIAKAKNAVQAEIFVEMVKERNEYASIRGYDNYAEYAYVEEYGRDYSTDDAKRFYEYVKKYIVPIENNMIDYLTVILLPVYDDVFSGYGMEDEEMVARVKPAIAKVHPDLLEAYEYLEKTHTYDMDYLETKMGIGFTVAMYQYGCPFIFNCSGEAYTNLETLIHEFGHYNNSFHNDQSALIDCVNMDVAEIHSQGLEALMLEYADDVYGSKYADAVRVLVLYNLLDAVVQGCVYDEFQNEIYAYDGELTAAECNRIFKRIGEQYGFNYAEGVDEAYSWVDVTHTFQSPMYYISYATSAIEALNIFAIAQEDRKKAVDIYMDISARTLETGFCELTELVSLPDIFEEQTIAEIGEQVDGYINDIVEEYSRKLLIKGIIIIAVIVIAVIGIITLTVILIVKGVKKRRLARKLMEDLKSESANMTVGNAEETATTEEEEKTPVDEQ